jgi:hypothetical protein
MKKKGIKKEFKKKYKNGGRVRRFLENAIEREQSRRLDGV